MNLIELLSKDVKSNTKSAGTILDLIEKSDLSVKDDNGNTAIMLAIKNRYDNEIVCRLIQYMVYPDATRLGINPPSVSLVMRRRTQAEQGNINNKNNNSQSAISYAIISRRPYIVEKLLEYGADPNITVGSLDKTLTMFNTALNYHYKTEGKKIFDLCVSEYNYDLGRTDYHGNSELHQACSSLNNWSVESLLDKSIDPNPRNTQGEHPLHLLMFYSKQPTTYQSKEFCILKSLLSAGADLKSKNGHGVSVEDHIINQSPTNDIKDLLDTYNKKHHVIIERTTPDVNNLIDIIKTRYNKAHVDQ